MCSEPLPAGRVRRLTNDLLARGPHHANVHANTRAHMVMGVEMGMGMGVGEAWTARSHAHSEVGMGGRFPLFLPWCLSLGVEVGGMAGGRRRGRKGGREGLTAMVDTPTDRRRRERSGEAGSERVTYRLASLHTLR